MYLKPLLDPEDPEYIRNLQRPAEVKEDMKQMEGRSRVSVVLNSQAFREELETVIHEQIRQGGPASIFALQQLSDFLLPSSRGASSSFVKGKMIDFLCQIHLRLLNCVLHLDFSTQAVWQMMDVFFSSSFTEVAYVVTILLALRLLKYALLKSAVVDSLCNAGHDKHDKIV